MLRPVHDVEIVVSEAAFWVALGLGAVGALVVWFRLRAAHLEPGVIVVATAACCVGLRIEHRLPAPLVVGLALLLIGDCMTRALPWSSRAVGVVPGALVLGAALPDGCPFWIRA